jgi:hypothetical protein
VLIPTEFEPIVRRLVATEYAELHAQALLLERTYSAAHPDCIKARQTLEPVAALLCLIDPVTAERLMVAA